MFALKSQRQNAAMTIVSGGLFITGWLRFVQSSSTTSSMLLVLSLVALTFASFAVLRGIRNEENAIRGSKAESFISTLIAVGNLGVVWLILADLYPALALPVASIGMAIWITFVLGYGLLGVALLRSKSRQRWAGLPFLLCVAAAVVVAIIPSWAVLLTGTVIGTTSIGAGFIIYGVVAYLKGTEREARFSRNDALSSATATAA